MISRILLVALMVTGLSLRAFAGDANRQPAGFTADNGVDVGIKGLFQYDSNQFSDDSLPDGARRFDNAQTWRRKEVSFHARRKGAFNAVVGYERAGEHAMLLRTPETGHSSAAS